MLKFKNHKSSYWNQFPKDESSFEKEVKKGIWIRVDDKNTLPEPPEGYRWSIDNGGLKIDTDTKITYRLWNDRLGYMPGQE